MNPFPPQFGWLVYQAHLYIDIFTIKFLPYIHIRSLKNESIRFVKLSTFVRNDRRAG